MTAQQARQVFHPRKYRPLENRPLEKEYIISYYDSKGRKCRQNIFATSHATARLIFKTNFADKYSAIISII